MAAASATAALGITSRFSRPFNRFLNQQPFRSAQLEPFSSDCADFAAARHSSIPRLLPEAGVESFDLRKIPALR